jgi:hypothetical protein
VGDSDAQSDGHGPAIVSLDGADIATGSQSDPIPVTKEFPHAGEPVHYVPTDAEDKAQRGKCLPYGPFYDEEIYRWCEYAITHKMTASLIDKMLKTNCGMKAKFKTHLPSRYIFMRKLDEMITNERLGSNVFQKSELHIGGEDHTFWHRDVVECAQWLLRQPCYRDHLLYSPVRSYNSSGSRVYGEMNTGDWWWDKQVRYKTPSQSRALANWSEGRGSRRRYHSADHPYVGRHAPHKFRWRSQGLSSVYDYRQHRGYSEDESLASKCCVARFTPYFNESNWYGDGES